MRNRDVFEVLIEHRYDRDAIVLGWHSRVFDAHQYVEVRHRWAHDVDPRRLTEFIEQLVGGTLENFARLRLHEGREIVHALMPHFEREIHLFMERAEYESRHRRTFNYAADVRFPEMWLDDWAAVPREDPEAKKKARALLVRNLDKEQAASFEKKGEFEVKAKDDKTYTIKTARSFNVVGPDGTKYCGQLQDAPVEDQMLAQKLLLEHEPDKFFKNANVSPATRGTTATEIQMRAMEYLRPGAIQWMP